MGETPLHIAARKNNYRVCRFLVEMGADVAVENEDRKLPVDKATDRRLIQYLSDEVKDVMRHRRSVFEPSISNAPATRLEGIAENSNSHSPAASSTEVGRAGPSSQFQSFLTIALATVKNHRRSFHYQAAYSSFPSPEETILNRADPTAIQSIWRIPDTFRFPKRSGPKISYLPVENE